MTDPRPPARWRSASPATRPIDAVADARARATDHTTRRTAIYGYLAAIWSMLYGGLALGWTVGIAGWPVLPFDRVGTDMPAALAGAVPTHLLAAGAVAAAGVAIAMANGWGRAAVRSMLLGAAWTVAAALALAFTTERVLILIGYAPIYLIGAPFGWAPDSFFDHVTWPVVHEMLCLLGAGLWTMAAVWYRRVRMPGGRGAAGGHAARVLARDRAAVAVAVAVPTFYTFTRYAWMAGVPLGITGEFLAELRQSGAWVAGAGLATFAMVGAALTLGLVQRWGAVLPGWVPVLGGRRVPQAMATVPATAVSVLLTSAGVMLLRQHLSAAVVLDAATWGAYVPTMLLPVWGVALGLATLGYRRRRQAT